MAEPVEYTISAHFDGSHWDATITGRFGYVAYVMNHATIDALLHVVARLIADKGDEA